MRIAKDNPYYVSRKSNNDEKNGEMITPEPVTDVSKTKRTTKSNDVSNDVIPVVSKETVPPVAVQDDAAPDEKVKYDEQVLEGISHIFKKNEKKKANTERVSAYLSKEKKDAFTKKCKKLQTNVNTALNELIDLFLAANN